jgi:hypothetical protein
MCDGQGAVEMNGMCKFMCDGQGAVEKNGHVILAAEELSGQDRGQKGPRHLFERDFDTEYRRRLPRAVSNGVVPKVQHQHGTNDCAKAK